MGVGPWVRGVVGGWALVQGWRHVYIECLWCRGEGGEVGGCWS